MQKFSFLNRIWIMLVTANGIIFLHCDPDIDHNFFIPDFSRRYKSANVKNCNTSQCVAGEIRNKLQTITNGDDESYNTLSGIYFYEPTDVYSVLNEWNYMNRRTNQTPILIYERELLDTVKVNCIVTMSCMDYIFAQKKIPQTGPLYRNKETLTNALQTPGLPKLSAIEKIWDYWTNNKNIHCNSRKYFCEKVYGYPTQPDMLRERNLISKYDGDPDKHEYLLLRLLAMEDGETSELSKIGFVWNRYVQAWAGESTLISYSKLDDFIRKDQLATPATMGFVPAWCAEKEVTKAITKGAKHNDRMQIFDNSSLWRMIA